MILFEADAQDTDKIRTFLGLFDSSMGLQSTRADLIEFSGDLYNVTGSSDDPRKVPGHMGLSWTALLKRKGDFSKASCYAVTPEAENGSSHPGFNVGGHMTPNQSGVVEKGEISYLMPLCHWHNHTDRNGIPFKHTEKWMVKLTGFMQPDIPFTFAMRLEDNSAHSILYFDPNSNNWKFKGLSEADTKDNFKMALTSTSSSSNIQEYAIFEKQDDRIVIQSSTIRNDS